MIRLPILEYGLSHPHPKGHWFLLATVLIFLFTLPVLVIVNLVTLGYDLVPSLQPRFEPNDASLEAWWGARRLPRLLRPRPPPCEPKDLGRGDNFRLSSSLFDYRVLSTWNTSESNRVAEVQEQDRVEYRGQSFADCYVNSVRIDYSMVEQTQSVNVGVLCPGYDTYTIEVSMETTMTFAWVLSKDFAGQYYGPGLRLLHLNDTDPSDYRKVVITALEVIANDALTIMRRSSLHLSNPILSTSIWFEVGLDATIASPRVATLSYMNGTIPFPFPFEATIYYDTITNLVNIAMHAVNLDLGNLKSPNIFRDASLLNSVILPNLPPNFTDIQVNSSNWAEGSQAFYYNLTPPYQTWAQSLLNGNPVSLHDLTGLANESVMVTAYLCPSYQIKPLSSLLASVFVGSATMTLSVWGAWMFFTTFLARQIMAPQIICNCSECVARRAREEDEAKYRAANPPKSGILAKLVALVWVPRPARPAKPTPNPGDLEQANASRLEYEGAPQSGRPTLSIDAKHVSHLSSSTAGEKS